MTALQQQQLLLQQQLGVQQQSLGNAGTDYYDGTDGVAYPTSGITSGLTPTGYYGPSTSTSGLPITYSPFGSSSSSTPSPYGASSSGYAPYPYSTTTSTTTPASYYSVGAPVPAKKTSQLASTASKVAGNVADAVLLSLLNRVAQGGGGSNRQLRQVGGAELSLQAVYAEQRQIAGGAQQQHARAKEQRAGAEQQLPPTSKAEHEQPQQAAEAAVQQAAWDDQQQQRRLQQYIPTSQPSYNLAPGVTDGAVMLPTSNLANDKVGQLLMKMGAQLQGAMTAYGASVIGLGNGIGTGGGSGSSTAASLAGAAPVRSSIVSNVAAPIGAAPRVGLGSLVSNLVGRVTGGGTSSGGVGVGVASYPVTVSTGSITGYPVTTGSGSVTSYPANTGQGSTSGSGAGTTASPSATGQFVAGGNLDAGLANGFYWTGGYWGYCPPPPTIASPASPAPPPAVNKLQAIIKDPRPGAQIATGPTGTANIVMDGSGGTAGSGRRIVSYAWVVQLDPDKTTAATGLGAIVQKTLGAGEYTITLQVGGEQFVFRL